MQHFYTTRQVKNRIQRFDETFQTALFILACELVNLLSGFDDSKRPQVWFIVESEEDGSIVICCLLGFACV